YAHPVKISTEIENLIVRINVDPERFNVDYRESGPAQIRLDSHGFGWMYFDHRVTYVTARAGRTMVLTYRVNPVSYFAELDHAIDLRLPAKYRGQLDIRLETGPDARLRKIPVQ
ncbi:MAG: hypothetical protein DRH90_26050, partial [Deltaproteobacteria bacterium]